MAARPNNPWKLAEHGMPRSGSPADMWRFLCRYAVLAPSGHNSQPWLFRSHGERLELRADRSRRLPVADHDDRELTLSCGAALFLLRAAARHHRRDLVVELCPDPADPDLLARVHVGAELSPSAEDETLFGAIARRRTHRLAYERRPISPVLLNALAAAARSEGAWVRSVERDQRTAVADLIAEADRIQGRNPAFRRELAAWVRRNGTSRRDGVPGFAFGVPSGVSVLGPLFVRWLTPREKQLARTRQMALSAPALAVLGTDGDTPLDWMRAGQALARVLLRATADRVYAAYLNMPLQVPEVRPRVSDAIGAAGTAPQAVLRLAYAGEGPHTPRRGVEEVFR
jgi:nitroreductase